MIRPKPFLTYFAFCAVPLLLFAGLNYWNALRTADSTTGTIVQDDLNFFNVAADNIMRDKESAILGLAMAPDVQRVVAVKNGAEISRLYSLPNLEGYFQTLTLFDRDRQALPFRIANSRPADSPQPDERVWVSQGNVLLDKLGSTPATVEYTAPIHDGHGTSNVGALVGVLDLNSVFSTAARGLESSKRATVVVLDRSGKVIFHSDRALR